MELGFKLAVLIQRRGCRKAEFAAQVGVTYRALANYIAGTRNPRGDVAVRMAKVLGVEKELLLDPRKNIPLTGEERFLFNCSAKSLPHSITNAADLLKKAKAVFDDPDLAYEDKQPLFACLTEIYFGVKKIDEINEKETLKT